MPQCCSVPKCSNRRSGHRFPLNPVLRKSWLIAIKRDEFTPTANSRVCKKHFKDEDYVLPKDSVRDNPKPLLRPGAVPTVFAWTSGPTENSMLRSERVRQKGEGRNKNEAETVASVNNIIAEFQTVSEENEGIEIVMQDDFTFVNEVSVISNDTNCALKIESRAEETNNGGMPVVSCDDELSQGSDQACEALLVKEPCQHAMRIADYIHDKMKEELHFYTGFDSYNHFMFFFNLLGPAVHKLQYHSSYSIQRKDLVKCMTAEDQFFLTMVKLRRFKINKELSYTFRISEHYVSCILITWINFLYCQLSEIDIWATPEDLRKEMKLKGEEFDATCIIDCTEIKIVQPKNPISQQQTYSHYKSCHTIKIFLAMTPTGAISFVSEVYGGAISDRELTEKCGFLDKLSENDVVLVDRGFNIQDLLASRNIHIKIPDFVPLGKGQLRPKRRKHSQKLSSKRIHFERTIALAKTYKIMKGPLSSYLIPLASRIVFVCFMLANFRSNIVM